MLLSCDSIGRICCDADYETILKPLKCRYLVDRKAGSDTDHNSELVEISDLYKNQPVRVVVGMISCACDGQRNARGTLGPHSRGYGTKVYITGERDRERIIPDAAFVGP